MATPQEWTVLLAGVGGDAHFVGLTVLRRGLARAGYQVIFLGTQNSVDDICAAAGTADAALISNMDGHARYYLADLALAQREYAVADRLWYLGGHPALDSAPETTDALVKLGFDRVFHNYVDLRVVLDQLTADLADRTPRGLAVAPNADAEPPVNPEGPAFLHPGVRLVRGEVLESWHTGAAARDLAGNAARLSETANLALAQQAAEAAGTILVQPRAGVSDCTKQHHLFAALADAGADVLSLQIDSLTRNNRYDEVERILKEALPDPNAASLLNGFPGVNHGVAAMAALTTAFPHIPFQVRHSTRDPRLLAELTFAAGISAFEGGGLTYNLPYYRDYSPRHSVQRWRYVDELAGLYWSEHRIVIDREFFGVLTACLVPPCLAIVVNVFEALLAAQAGVKSVTLGYAEQGHRAQDLAAVRATRSVADHYLAAYGFDDVAVHVVWHQYMGAFPAQPEKAKQLLVGSAVSAARSGAVRLMLKTLAEALRIPDLEDNASSLRLVRETCSRERRLSAAELSDADRAEEELLVAEARAILDRALTDSDGDVVEAAAAAVEHGWLDVPFSPSQWNAGKVLPVRDTTGAVRLATRGDLPFPRDVVAFHEQAVKARIARDGDRLEELIEHDIVLIARGEFDDWPLG